MIYLLDSVSRWCNQASGHCRFPNFPFFFLWKKKRKDSRGRKRDTRATGTGRGTNVTLHGKARFYMQLKVTIRTKCLISPSFLQGRNARKCFDLACLLVRHHQYVYPFVHWHVLAVIPITVILESKGPLDPVNSNVTGGRFWLDNYRLLQCGSPRREYRFNCLFFSRIWVPVLSSYVFYLTLFRSHNRVLPPGVPCFLAFPTSYCPIAD